MSVQKLPKQELNELATRIVKREVYLATHGPMLENSFGHLFMLMDEDAIEDPAAIGAVYEDMSKCSPRALNGYPIFFSCKLLHKEDVKPLYKLIEKKERAVSDGQVLRHRLLMRLKNIGK